MNHRSIYLLLITLGLLIPFCLNSQQVDQERYQMYLEGKAIRATSLHLHSRGLLSIRSTQTGKEVPFQIELDRYGVEGADAFEAPTYTEFPLVHALATARQQDKLIIKVTHGNEVLISQTLRIPDASAAKSLSYSLTCPRQAGTCISVLQDENRADLTGISVQQQGNLRVGISNHGKQISSCQVPYYLYLRKGEKLEQVFNLHPLQTGLNPSAPLLFEQLSISELMKIWSPDQELIVMPYDPDLMYAFPPEGFLLQFPS